MNLRRHYLRLRSTLQEIRNYWTYRDHLGSRYQCPICGGRLSRFRPLRDLEGGKHVRDIDVSGVMHGVDGYETLNVESFSCPICGAPDKARLYALYLQRSLPALARRTARLVHFAPESGLDRIVRRYPKIEYRTADLNRSDVDDRIDLMDMSTQANDSIGCFICSHVLEHVPDDRRAMSELYRVLKPGGWGIAMVPILLTLHETWEDPTKVTEADRLRHFGLEDHLRVYAKGSFVSRLEQAGFTVDPLGVEHFGRETFERCGISDKSVLYIVRK